MSGYLLETFVDVSKFSKKANASTAVVYDGKIHILGGKDRAQGLLHYSWDGTEWTQESELPYRVTSDSCAVVYNNKIHILGGSLSPADASHYSWDGSSWVSESTLPYRFSKGGAVVYDNKIHILGGGINTTAAKKYHRTYDGTNWSEDISTLPFAFYNCVNPIVHDNKIYIFNTTTARYYSWAGTSWTEEGRINRAFTRMAKALSYGGTIHLIGAGGTNNAARDLYLSSTGWVYDSAKLPYYGMSTASGCVIYDNKINVLSNRSGNNGNHYYLIDGPDYPVKSIKRAFVNAYYDRIYDEYISTEDYEWSTDPWKDYYEKVYNVETREWEYIKVSYDPEEPISPRDENLYEKHVVMKSDDRKVKKAWIGDEFGTPKIVLEAAPDETIISESTSLVDPDIFTDHYLCQTYDKRIHLFIQKNYPTQIYKHYIYKGNKWVEGPDLELYYPVGWNRLEWVVASGNSVELYFQNSGASYKIRYWSENSSGSLGDNNKFNNSWIEDIVSYNGQSYEIVENASYYFSITSGGPGAICNLKNVLDQLYSCACADRNYIYIFGKRSVNTGTGSGPSCIQVSRSGGTATVHSSTPGYPKACYCWNDDLYIFVNEKLYRYQGNEWIDMGIKYPFKGRNNYKPKIIIQDNTIHIFMSFNNYVLDQVSRRFVPCGFSYTDITTLPYNIESGAVLKFNNKIHLLGSYISGNSLKHYSWNGTQWSEESELPYDFYNGAAVIYHDHIHILGSGNNQNYKSHYYWDGINWNQSDPIPWDFYNGSAVFYDDKIYAFSTDGNYGYYQNGEWTLMGVLPFEFGAGGRAIVFNGFINVLYKKTHMIYNGVQWITPDSGELPYEFLNGSVCVFDEDELHIFGGTDNARKHYYKLIDDVWREEDDLGYDHVNGCVSSDDYIYVFGGTGPNSMNFEKINVNQYFS